MTDAAQGGARLAELRTANVSQLVFESIRAAIVNRSLPPGSRLAEAVLADQLNVSKTPVREAIIKLREIGLIEPHGRRGDRVVRPSRETLQNAYDIREALEVFAARRTVELASDAERSRIRTEAVRSLDGARSGDLAAFRSADDGFHRAITAVAGNRQLSQMIENVFTLIVTLRQRDSPTQDVSVQCGEQHVGIASAIEAHDRDGAERRVREHIHYVRDNVMADIVVVAPGDPS